ncbi:hypothetical protein ANO14919_139490 [Xylariales sp. No.14919]|nr:hypothetical protein ANO14919_139490 [Xylariales sp. No.14919]
MDRCTSFDNTLVVTSQDDIDNGLLSNCSTYFGEIRIRNATGTLRFTGQVRSPNISVADCPRLQVLEFPDTYYTDWLDIREANDLTNVSLPLPYTDAINVTAGGYIVGENVTSLTIVGAKSLASFDVGNTSRYFGNLTLLDLGPTPWGDVNWFNTGNITAAFSIEIDACLDLTSLEDVGLLKVSMFSSCFWPLTSIKSIGDYILTNINDSDALSGLLNGRGAGFVDSPPFKINESMILDSLVLPDPDIVYPGYGGHEIIPQVTTIGTDFNITSNTNVNLTFDSLTSVGASLFVYNNTISHFKFEKLSTVGNMLLIDNINTTLPWFPALTLASDIHLRGYIDTSIGPNIFPALQSVTGTVIVEAWNDDFDCSKLVQYQQDHLIHYLSCNGTNNGTSSVKKNGTDTSPHESNQALSQGAWAGIGVGIGVVVIGLVGSLIWLYIHFKRQLRSLAQTGPQTSSGKATAEDNVEPPPIIPAQEVDGAGIIREPDPIIELPARPAELASGP